MITLWLAAGVIAAQQEVVQPPARVDTGAGSGGRNRAQQARKKDEYWRIEIGGVVYTNAPYGYDLPPVRKAPAEDIPAEEPAEQPVVRLPTLIERKQPKPDELFSTFEAARRKAEAAQRAAQEREQSIKAQTEAIAARWAEAEANWAKQRAQRAEQAEIARQNALEQQRQAEEAARRMELARIDEEEALLALMLAA